MSRSTTPTSSFIKLPPIITNEMDRTFLLEINTYIDHEMAKIDPEDDEQRYIIYKTVFSKIISYVQAYKKLLTQVKREYEDTIEAIKKGQREAVFLHGKLKAMASEPSTIRNYKKRGDELEERIAIITKDNDKLEKQLKELREKRREREALTREVTEAPKREFKKDSRLIPGLSIEEATDLNLLYKNLDQLDRQLKDLNISFKTRYLPKSHKMELKTKLDDKVAYRDKLLRYGQIYRAKRYRLKIALEAAQAYNRVKPPHQTVGDAVFYAISQAIGSQSQEKETNQEQSGGDGQPREGSPTSGQPATTSTFEDDDPNKEKEAEMMLEYIEKFNELFEDGKYDDAAIHAANSPKGILRTSATLAKFKDVKGRFSGRSPLLAFCDAVMASVSAVSNKPNDQLSVECVECALNENRLDLLSYWISQERLTLSEEVGDLISNHCHCKVPCKCSCQALAQNVYTKIKLHHQALICLLRQGRVHAGIEYARNRAPLSKDQFVEVLKTCPSLPLLHTLVEEDEHGNRALPVGTIIMVLMENNHLDLVLPFMQELQNKPAFDDETTSMFQSAVLDDTDTTTEQWHSIVKLLQDHGYEETSMKLLSSITVLTAMKTALFNSRVPDSPVNEAQTTNTEEPAQPVQD